MNFNDIINQLAATDQQEQTANRRNMLKGMGAKLAAAAIPFGAASLYSNKANAQSKESIILALNYLLKLEYINDKFFTEGLAKRESFFGGFFEEQLMQVADHVKAHIETLKNTITDLGGTPNTIDYDDIVLAGKSSGGSGPFVNSLNNGADFRIQMAVFCDGSERMYKGQITEVFSDKETVRVLSTIHSVKARHAVFARHLRRYFDGDDVKPWITNANSDTMNTGAQAMYSGEDTIIHGGINVVGINGYDVTQATATQAFDEPLNRLDGEKFLDRFLK